jgi:ectoine hydroxylase-related dioxygenase (phytanoyl-CoA dioxygenase family)
MIAEQIETQGFAIIEKLFDVAETDALEQMLASAPIERSRAGARHAMGSSEVVAFAKDARLLAIVRAVLGNEAQPFRATLFDKSPESNWLVVWHQDTALPLRERRDVQGWGPWSTKSGVLYAHAPAKALDQVLALRIHLDDSSESNGPLRVIPNTHRLGVLSDEAIKSLVQASEPCDCLIARGGVLAMRPMLVHASSKSRTEAPRRVLHIEYTASMTMESGLDLAIA